MSWGTFQKLPLLSMANPVPRLLSENYEHDVNELSQKISHDIMIGQNIKASGDFIKIRETIFCEIFTSLSLLVNSRDVLLEGGRAMDAALAALFCNGSNK